MKLVTKLLFVRRAAITLMGLALFVAATVRVEAAIYTNATSINMPIGAGTTPYPSIITVSQLSGEIADIAVTLVNLTHANPDDIDVLLVGPQGQTLMLMSDAGGSADVSNLTITFTDAARAMIPDAGPMFAGIALPSNYDSTSDSFPNAPAPPYGTKLSDFNGTNPNGQWRLFVVDDSPFLNSGAIAGGWRLTINTTNRPPVVTTPLVDQVVPEGANVTFRVGVDGTPPFGYQWLRNGNVIVPFGQGTDTLRLLNVQSAQDGIYTVRITNGATLPAPVASQARLTVLSPIVITEPLPPLVETQPGGNVTLTIKAIGTPPLRYQWLLNGMVLTNQTGSSLRLVEMTPFSAGNYSALVWNDFETVEAGPTFVRVLFETAPGPRDFFQERPRLSVGSGVVQGDSSKAGAERDEPLLLGGGRTTWMEITPPDSGIMTLRTRGSAFDTLLSVFTGQDFREMKLVTQDDDRAGFYTSELQFNARRGVPYQIQIDGFGRTGAGGPFTLTWNLEVTQAKVPVIVSNPAPQAVVIGRDAVFRVIPETEDVAYQWFFLDPPYDKPIALAGETGPTLTIQKPGPRQVGYYYVVLRNQFDRFVIGPAVALQLGNLPFFIQDKFETMYLMSGSPSAGFISIGLGNSLFKEVPSAANRQAGDPSPCGSPFFGTLWEGVTATNTGIIQVETTGSAINARLAVYRLTGSINDFTNPPIICDLTSASNGVPAIAKFDAQEGTNYTVVVEGFQGSGNLQVTTKMGIAPALTNAFKYCLVFGGGSISLDMPASAWCPLPACQWRFNGVNIPNATNATLTVSNFSALNIGTYSVYVSNFVTSTTRSVAYLDLAPPFELHHGWATNAGIVGYKVTASNAAPFVLETTTVLGGLWTPIATNPDPCLILRYTNNAPLAVPQRFYRAVPWSGP